MIIDKDTDKLTFFQSLYDEAKAEAESAYEDFDKYYAQYKGDRGIDSINGELTANATQVRNITYELIESQISGYIPTPSVTPKMYSEVNERCAKSIETLLKNKRNELPFEKLNDMDERFSPIYGGSVWLVEWDDSIITHNTVGDVKISCLSPTHFIGQPNIYEISDMEYCFIKFDTTKEDIVRKYGVSFDVADSTESENNSSDERTATVIVCYYKDDDDKICQYIWSGDTELLDIEDYYARKRKVCVKCGKRKELCSCEKTVYEYQNEDNEELDCDIILSDGKSAIPAMSVVIKDGQPVMETVSRPAFLVDGTPAMAMDGASGLILPIMQDVQVPKTEPTKLPFFVPNVFPIVIRKNTSQENSLFGQSDCEFIRPQQQGINKAESRILEKLLKSGVIPIVPEKYEGELSNGLFDKPLRCRPEEINQFGRIDMSVDISKDVSVAERLYDQAKRILGISDSFQGQYDGSAQSGKAKQLQIQQAAGRLDSKRQMKNAAYAEIDKIIFQYFLAYADEPRPAVYIDSTGKRQNVMFNRYDFIRRDEAGDYYYDDGFLFSADASLDVDKSRELLWEENRKNYQSGAYGDPAIPQTQLMFWQNMERAHYPWARDMVENIKAEIERQAEMQRLAEETERYKAEVGKLSEEVDMRKKYEEYLYSKTKH